MSDKKLFKPIYIFDRQTGELFKKVTTNNEYITLYNYMLTFNDIKAAIKVFSDMWEQAPEKFLKDFDLIELINCFSTRYYAKKGNK